MTDRKPTCSICSKPIKATQAALFTNTPQGREHVHITCLRAKVTVAQERPAP